MSTERKPRRNTGFLINTYDKKSFHNQNSTNDDKFMNTKRLPEQRVQMKPVKETFTNPEVTEQLMNIKT